MRPFFDDLKHTDIAMSLPLTTQVMISNKFLREVDISQIEQTQTFKNRIISNQDLKNIQKKITDTRNLVLARNLVDLLLEEVRTLLPHFTSQARMKAQELITSVELVANLPPAQIEILPPEGVAARLHYALQNLASDINAAERKMLNKVDQLNLLKQHIEKVKECNKFKEGAVIGLLEQEIKKVDPTRDVAKDISPYLAQYLNIEDGINLSRTCKNIHTKAEIPPSNITLDKIVQANQNNCIRSEMWLRKKISDKIY